MRQNFGEDMTAFEAITDGKTTRKAGDVVRLDKKPAVVGRIEYFLVQQVGAALLKLSAWARMGVLSASGVGLQALYREDCSLTRWETTTLLCSRLSMAKVHMPTDPLPSSPCQRRFLEQARMLLCACLCGAWGTF